MEPCYRRPRTRAHVFALIFFVLFVAWLESGDQSQNVIEARKADLRVSPPLTHPLGFAASMTVCVAGKCDAPQYVFRQEEKK